MIRTREWFVAGSVMSLVLVVTQVRADDYTFTNSVGSPSYNTVGNWDLGAVPGVSDNARFTNSATYTVGFSASAQNAKTTFDASGGNVTLGIASSVWALSNSVVVGASAGASPSVLLSTGTLMVTNNGAGLLDIGTGGAGTFTIQGAAATSVVDRILVTNVISGIGNSYLNLRQGLLTTLSDSAVFMATNGASSSGPNYGDFRVGSTNGNPASMTWNIAGGTLLVNVPSKGGEPDPAFMVAGNDTGRRGIMNVSGAGTVVSNYGGGCLLIGAAHSWGGGGLAGSGNNQLNITGGATVYNKSSTLRIGWGGAGGNSILVSGSGSLLSAYTLTISKSTDNNSLTVTNGGQAIFSGTASIGEGQGGAGRITVAGSNSVCICNNSLSFQGNNDSVLVSDGGLLRVSPNLYMNDSNKAANNNRFVVSGAGSIFTNSGTTAVALTTRYKPTTFSNVLFRVEQGGLATMVGDLVVGGYDNNAPTNCVGAVAAVSDSGSLLQCRDVKLSKYWTDATVNLVVSNAASMVSRDALVGSETVSAGNPAFAGAALVVGSNSLWRLTGALYVGYLSSGFLTVSNGGKVVSAGCVVGNSVTATGNVLNVTSGSLSVTNTAASALLDIRCGTLTVANNGSVTADKLTFTNTVDALTFVAGTNGLGTVKVKGALTLLAGSKLKVDLTGYAITSTQRGDVLTLFEYGSLPTPFNPANVQIVNPKFITKLSQGSGTNDKITLTVFRAGTMIMVY